MGEEDWYKLSLIASNLPNKGWPFRTSSPYAIVKRIDGETETVLGQTEYVFHSLDPDWCKSFYFAKSPGTQIDIEEVRETQIEVEKSPMLLEITVWDYREGRRAKKIGTAVKFDPTQMIDQEVAIPIPVFCRNSKLYCKIERVPPLSDNDKYYKIHLRGLDMKNLEPGLFGLGRSDPFFELAKFTGSAAPTNDSPENEWDIIHRSEYISEHLNPIWKPLYLRKSELGDNVPLRIQVWDHNKSIKHGMIGEIRTTFAEMQSRISVMGNADRRKDIAYNVEIDGRIHGLVCVLDASISTLVNKDMDAIVEDILQASEDPEARYGFYIFVVVLMGIFAVVIAAINGTLSF